MAAPKLDVGRVEPNQIAHERQRALGVVSKARDGFGQHGEAKLTAIAARRREPCLKLFEIRELEALEELASKETSELHDRLGVEGPETRLGRANAMEIHIDIDQIEPYARSIGDDPRPSVLVE